jgi:hypothetical protein
MPSADSHAASAVLDLTAIIAWTVPDQLSAKKLLDASVMLKIAGNSYGHLEPINRKMKFINAVKKAITHFHLILSGGEASILSDRCWQD